MKVHFMLQIAQGMEIYMENKECISQKTQLGPLYMQKIKSMHNEKIRLNKEKLERFGGSYNTDDHGFICFDDFKFEPIYNDDNMIYGCELIGKNLRKFLGCIPAYIHEDSALAGCWVGFFQNFAKIGLNPKDVPTHLTETHEKYGITQPGIGGMNHMAPDMNIGLQLGFKGLLDKLVYYKNFNAPASSDFYNGEIELVEGILAYIQKHVDYANEMYTNETDPQRKENYLAIAKANENLLTNPPKNFREACQFIAHFQSVDRTYFGGGALGQLDELLRPYFEADKKSGLLTDEQAVWIIASLLYNDTHYSQIDGVTPDGTKGLASRLSFIILDAIHYLGIPENIGIRVCDKTNPDLFYRAVEYILEDGSGVCFSLAKGIEEGFVRNGHPIELARMRAKVGCNWVALPGIEYPLQDVTRINMAYALIHALEDIKGNKDKTTTELWERFCYHISKMVECIKEGYDIHYEVVSKSLPEIVLNLFCHGTIERGLNAAQGGVDIIGLNLDGIALATVADSFAAIEQRIEKENRLTWDELYTALGADFEGYEDIRLMLKNIPRFGVPDSLAEGWAERVKDEFVYQVKKSKTPKHNIDIIPGLFSHGDIYAYGKNLPATPNGRRKGDPISHSSEPDPGFAQGLTSFSPTLKANAVAIAQAGYGNSAPLHLDIDSDMMLREGGIEALIALIKTHNDMGGTLINLNCVTKDQIMKAHENPDNFPDLVVRVTGYSAFFASLSKDYRQQVVDRYLTDSK